MVQPFDFKYIGLLQRNYLRNRTIVSSDIRPMLNDIAETVGHDLIVHEYPSGMDSGTWIIPLQWDVREAWLKGPDGKMIASYDDHPLFAVPYTQPFSGIVDLETLKKHVRLHPTLDNAFYYEHRFAYDFRLRLTDWAITLPRNVLNTLIEGEYTVHLDYDIRDGEMLVGELYLPGETNDCIALLTDYCHPGQVNDSFTGILVMSAVFERLKKIPNRKYTYRLLFFPETIGSCVLLHEKPDYISQTRLAIFSEFVGWGKTLKILGTRGENVLTEKLGRQIEMMFDDVQFDKLTGGYENDEMVFDFAGIPSMSVQMTDCSEYHSSLDRPELIQKANLSRAASVIYDICQIMERDQHLQLKQNVPIYLTRYGLYSDSVYNYDDFEKNRSILYGLRNGGSLLDIAISGGMEFEYVYRFTEKLLNQGLIFEYEKSET